MKKLLNILHHYFIPGFYWEEEQSLRKAKILVNTLLITLMFASFYVANGWFLKMPIVITQIAIYFFLFLSVLFLFRAKVSLITCSNIFCGLYVTSNTFDAYFTGGLNSATLPWFGITPMLAILFTNLKIARIWLIIVTIIIVGFGMLKLFGFETQYETPVELRTVLEINSYVGLLIILYFIQSVMERAYKDTLQKLDEKNKLLDKEKQRSDELILNILPSEIVTELKDNGHSKARFFNHVSVLFTDFVNFTKISETMGPEELVDEIDYCFGKFDEIIERNNLEKIKTIGDAYLAVCGLPLEDKHHAIKTVNTALEIMQFTHKRQSEGGKFDIRIGIHSGSLVAGVVGIKKFAYDIWGDTVNTACRMEQSSEPGYVNISEDTYQLVKDEFIFQNRGTLEVKHKGIMQMYFVTGKKTLVEV